MSEIGESKNPVDVTLNQDGGVLKVIKRSTNEEVARKPFKGDRVFVHYVGTLKDSGEKFDSSRDRGEQFSFNLGKSEVIKGWELGVASMAVGELAEFTIKPEYAYGEKGSPPKIPENATLVFEIELFGFEGEDISKDNKKTLIKRTIKVGEGLDHPNDESFVEIDLRAEANGRLFDEREVQFTLGEGSDINIPCGIELAIEKMRKKEICQVTITDPEYGFQTEGWPDKKIEANSHEKLVYILTLKRFERSKESWQLNGEQKLEQSLIFKQRGNHHFKNGKFQMSLKKYQKIIDFLEHEISLEGGQETARKSMVEIARLNFAMCQLKLENYIDARNICDKVIEENDKSIKGYYRRGDALFHLKDYELAKDDFEKVLALDPDNANAKFKRNACVRNIKSQKAKERKVFANMFDKFAKIDAEKEAKNKKETPLEINQWENTKGDNNYVSGNGMDSIKVSGDVNMSIDLNEEIEEITREEEP